MTKTFKRTVRGRTANEIRQLKTTNYWKVVHGIANTQLHRKPSVALRMAREYVRKENIGFQKTWREARRALRSGDKLTYEQLTLQNNARQRALERKAGGNVFLKGHYDPETIIGWS